jgi:DNA polymerase-3 subunit epsilon
MRQIVLDTETTGLEVSQGHRIIEIGCIELINRRVTGNHWHYYFNPDREVDIGAFEVHGISDDFLQDKPRFTELAEDFRRYVEGAELVIHNAAFDVGFLNHELSRLETPLAPLEECCTVLDTLMLARQKHPGQKNNLDALCKRYDIDNSQRSLHGALLDARILADVYLAMTGGQTSLGLEADQASEADQEPVELRRNGSGQTLPLWQVGDASLQANREYIEFLATQHEDPAWK